MKQYHSLTSGCGFLIIALLLVISSACSLGNPYTNVVSTKRVLEGEDIYQLVIDPKTPTTVYATADDGVNKSTDGGENWTVVTTQTLDLIVTVLAIDPVTPSTLYLGTYDDGVFKTIDGGMSWNAANNGLTITEVTTLAINPLNPTTIYAGIGGEGVFKSTDGGGSWSLVNTGMGPKPGCVVRIAIDPQTPSTLYAVVDEGGVFKSTNSGESWNSANIGLTSFRINDLIIDPKTPTTLYAGTRSDGVFTSTDGGENWSGIWTNKNYNSITALAIDPVKPAHIFAGTYRMHPVFLLGDIIAGLFVTIDGGVNWSGVRTSLNGSYIYDLEISSEKPASLYVATNHGVYILHQQK